jgi:hypothetical protein
MKSFLLLLSLLQPADSRRGGDLFVLPGTEIFYAVFKPFI